jgi:hypothetical protein
VCRFLLGLLPGWRDFTPDECEEITWPVIIAAAQNIGDRLLKHVGQRPGRWRKLLELWPNFDSEWRAKAASQLAKFARDLNDPSEVKATWDALYTLSGDGSVVSWKRGARAKSNRHPVSG